MIKNNKIDGALSRSITQTTNTYLNMSSLFSEVRWFPKLLSLAKYIFWKVFFHEQDLSLTFCKVLDNSMSDHLHNYHAQLS